MGLGMIETMKIFDAERHEGIKMRVGIHTGKIDTLRFLESDANRDLYRKHFVRNCRHEACEVRRLVERCDFREQNGKHWHAGSGAHLGGDKSLSRQLLQHS